MKTLSYEQLTKSQRDKVEALIADLQGNSRSLQSVLPKPADNHFVAVIGDDCDREENKP